MNRPRKPARKSGPSGTGRSRSGSLRARLEEAEETLRAIRSGEVDAVVVSGSEGEQVYVVKGADHSYRSFMEQMSEGAALIGTQRICIYANPRLAHLLGVPIERLVGSSLDVFVPEEERARFRALVEADSPVLGRGELSLIKGDGSRVPVLVSVGKADLDGSVGTCLVATDITERKIAEKTARRLSRALNMLSQCNEAVVRVKDEAALLESICRSIVEHGGYRMCWVGIAEHDQAKTVRPVAQAGFEDGYPQTAVVSWSATDRGRSPTGKAISDREPVVARNLPSQPTGEPWPEETLRQGCASCCALPVVADDQVLGALTLYAEEPDAFARSEVDLLTRLADDVAFGLTMLRLRAEREQLQAQLMSADRMVTMGTLAAGVAHEINSPLAYMTTNLDLVERDLPKLLGALGDIPPGPRELFERVPERLRRVRDGAQRIRNVVGDLKTFSRADGETMGRVDLRRVLDASISMAWAEIRHRARLVRDFADVPAVTGNESRLGQVFLNLLTNAAQSIGEGRVDDNEIRVTAGLDRQGRVMVEIRDTGLGIPSEHLSRVFDPFFTSKPIGVGTGLGLAICRSIVNSLGGEITAESQPGAGSAFRVLLPPAPSLPDEETTPSTRSTTAPPEGTRVRILVVDDEPDICEAMQEALGEHEVVALTDSRAALQRLLGGEHFDLIFCDLMMPNLTGWELHERLVQVLPEVAKRFVFVTGGAFTSRAREYLARTTAWHLEKPFDLSALLSLVSRHLRRRG